MKGHDLPMSGHIPVMVRFPLISGAAAFAVLGAASAVAQGSPAAFHAPACTAKADAGAGRTALGEPPVDDMKGPEDGVPHGAIDTRGKPISWTVHPRVWRGNTPRPGWSAVLSWGVIYTGEANRETDAQVEIRNLQLFVKLRTTGQWCLLDDVRAPHGKFYHENFSDDTSLPGDVASTATSTTFSPMRDRVFHFWGRRLGLPTGGINGMYVQYEARLLPMAARPLSSEARFLGAASADYWISTKTPAGQPGVLNEDAAIGRLKWISSTWRLFTMNTNGGPALAPANP